MDNRKIDIVSEGDTGIALALALIWDNAAGGKATHYVETRVKCLGDGNSEESENGRLTLILLWHEEGHSKPLPYPLKQPQAIEFVKGWLAQVDYGRQPDHDGDNGRGWRIFTDYWGHVADHHYAICGIQPIWAMYGK